MRRIFAPLADSTDARFRPRQTGTATPTAHPAPDRHQRPSERRRSAARDRDAERFHGARLSGDMWGSVHACARGLDVECGWWQSSAELPHQIGRIDAGASWCALRVPEANDGHQWAPLLFGRSDELPIDSIQHQLGATEHQEVLVIIHVAPSQVEEAITSLAMNRRAPEIHRSDCCGRARLRSRRDQRDPRRGTAGRGVGGCCGSGRRSRHHASVSQCW